MMVPVDAKLAQYPDFQEVFGTTELPLCAVVARNRWRDRWVRIYSDGYEYDVMAWKATSRGYLDDLPQSRIDRIQSGVQAIDAVAASAVRHRSGSGASAAAIAGAGAGAGAGVGAGAGSAAGDVRLTPSTVAVKSGHGDGALPLWHSMPRHFGDRVRFWDRQYVRVSTKGKMRWLSEVLDPVLEGPYVAGVCVTRLSL